MYYNFYPLYDSTIYEKEPTRNTGIDQILELTKFTANQFHRPSGEIWENTYNSRILIKFNITNLSQSIVRGDVSNTSRFYLSLKATDASDLPISYTIYAYPISQSWENGNGHYNDIPTIREGVSWTYRDAYFGGNGTKWITGSFTGGTTGSYESNSGGSTWYLTPYASQSFNYENPDIRMDVTNIVRNWLSGTVPNEGFVIKRSTENESSTTIMGSVKFFSKDTHTIYLPKLEAVWDDSAISSTGSLSEISQDLNYVVFIKNIREKYRPEDVALFRLHVRDPYPIKTYATSSDYLTTKILPTNSYYSVKDSITHLDIVPFDENGTKLSVDSNGNYFLLNMNSFLPDRYYKVVFKVHHSDGQVKYIDNAFNFRVSKS